MNSWFKGITFNKFVPGFIIASLLFGGAAIAVNVNNTPQGGYLLCANNKTRAVTYPGTLKCPSGTTAIEVPGQNGFEAPISQATPMASKSVGSNATSSAGDPNCNLVYLRNNPTKVSEVVPNCSSANLQILQTDLNKFQEESTKKLDEERIAINKLKVVANSSTDKAAAEKAMAELSARTAAFEASTAEVQQTMAILTAVVQAIAKKVKA